MDQTISINQMKDYASKLKIGESNVLYVPEVDQLIIIVREATEKVAYLRSKESIRVATKYIEEHNVIHFGLRPDLNDDRQDVSSVAFLNDDLIRYLKKVANSTNSILFITVGDDLETISLRHCFTSDLTKFGLQQELNRILESIEL